MKDSSFIPLSLNNNLWLTENYNFLIRNSTEEENKKSKSRNKSLNKDSNNPRPTKNNNDNQSP